MIARKFPNDRGSSNGRVEYVAGKGHDHKVEKVTFVGGNVFGSKPEDLVEEMNAPCALRKAATGKDTGLCHMHYMLSLAPGESLNVQQWRDVLYKAMSALGYTEDHKFYGEIHDDTGCQHMHIVSNRISMSNYNLLSESNDYQTLMNVCREAELEYDLQVVPMPHETWGVNLTREEVEASQKSGEVAWKHKVIARIATAIERTHERNGDMLCFIKLLKKAEINIQLTLDNKGEPRGISFDFQGKSKSGEDIKGTRFTWPKLIKQEGLHYDKSMFQEIQRIASTRDAEPAEKPGPKPTAHKGLYVTPNTTKRKKAFAIVVHTDRLRRTALMRLLEPSYSRGNKLFYVFHSNEKLTRNEVQMKIMAETAMKMTDVALRLIEAILSIFRCKFEIDYAPDDSNELVYSLDEPKEKPKPKKTIELSPA